VIDGADRLREGAKVSVRNGAGRAAGGATKPDPAEPATHNSDGAPPEPAQGDPQKRKRRQNQDGEAPAANPSP
jgi:membrane fusion protein, multidrug efflux system